MNIIVRIIAVLTVLQVCFAPPVKENSKDKPNPQDEDYGAYMEYHRYLSEVVQALESDADFKNKLQTAAEDDIRSGKIADELQFVNHHVRTKLDEIKRVEVERLKELMEKKEELQKNTVDTADPTHKHIDHSNPHTFEIEDLKKLIAKTQEDLAEVDRKRKEEFKEYELQKELEKQRKLNASQGEERAKLEKQYMELEEKHKNHDKLHQPGHKAQLEEVWKEQDHMDQAFNPKTFFLLHDVDSNGYWDQNEVKGILLNELNKMYEDGAPEDDIRERLEELERMRETIFKEMDINRDGFIDYPEFFAQTQRKTFNEDNGWNGLDEQKPFNDEELQEYIAKHNMPPPQYQHNMPPPQYQNNVPPPQYQHNIPPPQYQNNIPPPQYQNNIPPPQYQNNIQQPQQQNNIPQAQHQNNMPPAQYQHNIQQQQQQNNIPQAQYQNNMPQQQHQNGIPQQHQNNIPQTQYQNNIPQPQHQNIPPSIVNHHNVTAQ